MALSKGPNIGDSSEGLVQWPLRFKDAGNERTFLEQMSATNVRLVRTVIVLATVIVLLYDLVFRGLGEPNVNQFLIYRFAYIGWLCVMMFATYTRRWIPQEQFLLTVSVILASCTWSAMGIVAKLDISQSTFFASNILVMMFAGGFGMLRTGYAVAAILATFAITVLGRTMIGTETVVLVSDAALLLTTAFISTVSAYLLERGHRESWLKQQTILSQRDLIIAERARADDLLRNILPDTIANRLKNGERPIADSFAEVTVLFADVEQFTQISARIGPKKLVELLNDLFSAFDSAAATHGIEKVKTDGDAYMAVCGAPDHVVDHAQRMLRFAIDVLGITREIGAKHAEKINIRIGINSGPVVAGVIGRQRIIYDLWGDTVNVASRLEGVAKVGNITLSDSAYHLLCDPMPAKTRKVQLKGKGEVTVYDLTIQ